MNNDVESSEVPKFTRKQVVDAFKKFPKRGITHPDDLSSDDTDVISANALLQVWDNQQKAEVKRIGTPEAEHEYNLSRYTIYVDAGFTDPDYLDEVASDWLQQDLQAAEDVNLKDVAAKIQAKIDEIEAKLAK